MPVNKIRDDLDVFVDSFRASNVGERSMFCKQAGVPLIHVVRMVSLAGSGSERDRLLARVNLKLCRDGFGPRRVKGVD